MKVYVKGFPFQGKVPYDDARLSILRDKFHSAAVVPFSIEFIQDTPSKAECFLINAAARLDFAVEDMEKLERNLYASADKKEVLQRALNCLEQEKMLHEGDFSAEEVLFLKNLNLFTIKPGLIVQDATAVQTQLQQIVKELIDRSGRIFFFTAGKKDSHAWDVYRGTTMVEAAGKIHTDLQRGFIRAEVYNVKDSGLFGTVLQEAKAKGLLKTVERTYVVEDGDVVDIKFSV